MSPQSYAAAADPESSDHGKSPKDLLDERKAAANERDGHGTSTKAQAVQEGQWKGPQTLNVVEPEKASTKQAENEKPEAKSSYNKSNEAVANVNNDSRLEREYTNINGGGLTSTKAPPSYSTALDLDKQELPVQLQSKDNKSAQDVTKATSSKEPAQLVSGRRAGSGWQRSRIRYAPLNIPLQRRLQTLAVLWHGLSIAGLLAVFLFLCAIPVLWPILLPYTVYCLLSRASVSGQLSHRSERLRRSPLFSLFASYYPARLHRSAELPATRKYIFGYHPHGIISHGAFAAFATEALGFAQLFPGITNTLLTLDSNFRVPLYRDYALAMGLGSVSRESCENLLTRGGPNGEGMGRAITIVVGGARESLDSAPNSLKLVLKRRKGFVKLAIRTGADLVPVLGFGENDLYDQFDAASHPRVHRAQLIVKRIFGFTVPLFHARGVFNYDVGLLPYRRPLNIVVGKPIRVEQQKRPDEKTVDALHAQYVDEVLRLWDEWKDEFARGRTSELEIVE